MDFYYRKSMGNGAVTSKFRLLGNNILTKESNERETRSTEAVDVNEGILKETNRTSDKDVLEHPETHHTNNCNRCYRLKKKCSRLYPKCSNCEKMGAVCEYVTRTNKRRKKNAETVPGEGTMAIPQQVKEAEVFEIKEKDSSLSENSVDTSVSAHRLVTISSLLSSEMIDEIQDKDINKRIIPKKKNLRRESNGVEMSIVEKLRLKRFKSGSGTKLKDEFVTMKPIRDETLPTIFIANYFHNFEHKYPFINKAAFVKNFESLKFENETIIYFDVYLLMSIGCLIYDSNFKTKYFDEYFSHKTISCIVDIISLNIDQESEDDLENVKLLLLLTIYSLYNPEINLHWELIGILGRLVSLCQLYKPSPSHDLIKQRIFWSVYNLDKEFSLSQDIPSQIPCESYLGYKFPITTALYQNEDINLINQQIKLSKLKNNLLDLKLKAQVGNAEGANLRKFSEDLEKWRISASSTVHNSLAHSPYLQDFISLINLEFYYLSIELDQISSSESLQFTLQFLSNSYSLFMIENSKTNVEISLNSVFWYANFFKVIRNSLSSLIEILKSGNPNKSSSMLKVSELNGNLQLIINLLRYVYQVPTLAIDLQEKIKTGVEVLTTLNLKLIRLDICAGSEEQKNLLIKETEKIKQLLQN